MLFQKCPEVIMYNFEPVFPRKHITLYLEGPWKKLVKAKLDLKAITDERLKMLKQPSFRDFESFQLFAFHKQLRFTFKMLKRVIMQNAYRYLSHWDTCTNVIESTGTSESTSETGFFKDVFVEFIPELNSISE